MKLKGMILLNIPLKEVDWDQLAENITFLNELHHKKNQTLLIVLNYGKTESEGITGEEVDGATAEPFDISEREKFLCCDEYICYKVIQDEDTYEEQSLLIIRYRFIEKIFDCNNNLLVFANTDTHNAGCVMPKEFFNKIEELNKENKAFIFRNDFTELEIYPPNKKSKSKTKKKQ